MLVRPYNDHKDRGLAAKCLKSQDMSLTLLDDLPTVGFVAVEGDEPVALGFVRQVEGPYVMFDSYLSNSDVAPELRDRALNLITRKLLGLAKRNGVKKVLAFSLEPRIITRAQSHGFVKIPYEFTVLDLS